MKTLDYFTNQFPVQKTLKLGLLPEGATRQHLVENNPMDSDAVSVDKTTEVKRIADEYHKYFINVCLSGITYNTFLHEDENLLESFENLYLKIKRTNNRKDRKEVVDQFVKVSNTIRALLVERFTSNPIYEKLYNKNLVTELIPSCPTICQDDKDFVTDFKTTLLNKYNYSRKNMYSDKADETAIANRLVNENFPRYIDNIQSLAKILESSIGTVIIEEIAISFDKELGDVSITDFFSLNSYPKYFTQKSIDRYNAIIKGKLHEEDNHVEGINSLVKKYNDTIKDRKQHLPLLKSLHKSILSDVNIKSFRLPDYTNDAEMASDIMSMYEDVEKVVFGMPEGVDFNMKQLFGNIKKFDAASVYVNASALELLSVRLLGRYDYITKGLQKTKAYNKSRKEYSLQELDEAIAETEKIHKDAGVKASMSIYDYFKRFGLKKEDNGEYVSDDFVSEIKKSHTKAKSVLERCCNENSNIRNKDADIEKIKNLLDNIKRAERFLKLFVVESEIEKDESFYLNLEHIYDAIHRISKVYVRTKNRLTRKPYSSLKYQLSFDYVNIMKGWSDIDGHCLLLEKNGKQYLAVINNWSKYKEHLELHQLIASDGDGYKFSFGQGGRMGQNIERLMVIDGQTCLKKTNLEELYETYVDENINKLRVKLHSSNDLEKDELIKYINFYRQRVVEFYTKYDFSKLKASEDYASFDEFVSDLDECAYKMEKEPINWSVISDLNKKGYIYLFQIYCKDFSDKSKGKPNLQTLYWRHLLSEENLRSNITRITGKGTLYFRPASIKKEDAVVHKKNRPMNNKRHINGKMTTTLNYTVTKDKRFTEKHFEIHIPIMLNYTTSEKPELNNLVQEHIRCGNINHVIGIDRGERNLLYVTVVDMNGNIKEQTSLNVIDVEFRNEDGTAGKYGAEYHEWMVENGLDKKAKMKDWHSQTNTKNLKTGFISQAVHKITQLVVKYNAVISLEALSKEFMKTRSNIEHRIYQRFETALISKLNYLVFKDSKPGECGSVEKPIQLADGSQKTESNTRQNGIVFFVAPWKTSKIDPSTGFSNFLTIRYDTNKDTIKFIKTFKSIKYNKEEGWFEFVIDEKKKDSEPKEWTICSFGKRIEFFRNIEKNNEPDYREIDLSNKLKDLFNNEGLDLNEDLVPQIASVNKSAFYKDLLHLMKLMVQLRNSDKSKDELRSPVKNRNGVFFNSYQASANQPKDADANGAFNIARKALMLVDRIKSCPDYLKKDEMFISNEEWIEYAQMHPAL